MPTVTALLPQVHHTDRVNLHLDGEFAFGLAVAVVLARGLRVGDSLSDAEVEMLRGEEETHGAYAAALNFLSFRPRAQREIETFLKKRDVEPHEIDAIIARLATAGLLDDREFARFWVDNRQTFRPRGTMALRAEMRQKGLDTEVIDDALSGLPDEENAAYEACAPKMRSFSKMDDREFSRKLLGFLQRRGFPYAVAAPAVKRRLAERGGSAELDDL